MSLSPGTRLGPYEIESAIGSGGMGEVYKARDTRLNRAVALKVLPQHVRDNPEFKQRFEREAQTIAALEHPHICVLHDIGHDSGIDFLVMEYLEGQTLSKRLEKGALPLEQALQYAVQIADALDKAHRAGIIHRDLKPSNIMLTNGGVKLLDFGLSKLAPAVPAGITGITGAATQSAPLTGQGTILGTLQYMAPEQLEGKEADARSDVFAFGATVYEIATGRKAFDGSNQASVIAKILDYDPPPMSSIQPLTPPALDRVVKRCLAKEPDDRWQTVRDLEAELKWIAEGPRQTAPVPTTPTKAIRATAGRPLFLGVGALVCASVIASVAIWNLRPTPAPLSASVTRFTLTLPPGDRLVEPNPSTLSQPPMAISPDGRYIAYVASRSGTQRIFLRALDSQEVRLVLGTEASPGIFYGLFFSPDSQWLGFQAGENLRKIPVSGGVAPSLRSGPPGFDGATWSGQGTIILGSETGLWRMPDSGGVPELLTRLQPGEDGHRWPDLLPGGNAVLFAGGTSTNPRIAVYSVESGERRDLIQAGTYPRYVQSGHVVYAQADKLMAVAFDAERLEVTGTPIQVIDEVLQGPLGAAAYSISATGTLVYLSGGAAVGQYSVVWVDRKGAEQPLGAPAQRYGYPRISPDGRRVAVELNDRIWVIDLAKDTLTQLTFQGTSNQDPVWSPEGNLLAFRADDIFSQLADGSGGLERLNSGEHVQLPKSWSPDGRLLAFVENHPTTLRDIWILRLSDRKAEPFLQTRFIEAAPNFSPDGRWLAYVSNESGEPEIYVQSYPGPGGKWRISTRGGTEPVWNRNGRELLYRNVNKMMAIEVITQPKFSTGKPRVLFEGEYLTSQSGAAYDISPDGQRFLMVKENDQPTSARRINVVVNWHEELKRLVPTN